MNLFNLHSDPKSLLGFNNAYKVPKLSHYLAYAPKYQVVDVLLKLVDCIHAIEYSGNLQELDPMPESLASGFNPMNTHDWEALKASQNNHAIAIFNKQMLRLKSF